MTNDICIDVRGLVKKFANFTANDNLTFSVRTGEIFGFLGANGAGKTTAMRQLCGLLTPTSGYAAVAGFDVYTEAERIKKNIGYMSQKFSLYNDLTVQENIDLFGRIYGLSRREIQQRSKHLLNRLGLFHARARRISDIPLGWKQKLAFSSALLHSPGIVFLDEPTSGVDPVTRRQFWEMIYETAEQGTTIFLTTHYMDEAEYCSRLSIMVDGGIREMGTPQEITVRHRARSIEEVFVKLAGRSQ